MHTVQFDSDKGYKTFVVIPDDKKVYNNFAIVEQVNNDLFAVVIDYIEYDSNGSDNFVDFVDAFSTIERAEALALTIKKAMDNATEQNFSLHKKREAFGIDYENDLGRMARCGLSKWFSWGSSFQNIAIVRSANARLEQHGIEYR
jgi:hypothetical protein